MKLATLANALLFTGVAFGGILLPSPKGPFKIKWESQELVDESRQDPFNSTHPRRIMISRFTPVLAPLCSQTCRVPYMPKHIARYEDAILQAFLPNVGWPSGVTETLELELCCKSLAPKPLDNLFPKLIFSTGLNTTRLSYSATVQYIASLGYEVIVMDHPYETDVVEFPNGDIIYGGRILKTIPSLEFGLDVRSKDAAFLMNKLRIRKTTFIGQSFGGAAAVDILTKDTRIMGGVNLDGALFGPGVTSGVSRPFLIFGSEGHNSTSDTTFAKFLKSMDEKQPDVWKRELSIQDSSHGSCTDMSLIGDVTGLRSNPELVENIFGKPSGARIMEILQRYLGTFVEFTLHHGSQGILAKPSKEFPEVKFIRQ